MGVCNKFCEFASALIAAFGAFVLGAVISWMAPAQIKLINGDFGYDVKEKDTFWLGAIMTIGAAVVCIPMGFLINIIGRKFSMIIALIPIIAGWILLIWGSNLILAFVGRFILGVGAGSFCVCAPVYTTEVAELKFRGMFGSMFQVMIVTGVCYGFVIGALIDDGKTMSVVMGVPSLPLLVLLFFVPFSPVFLLSKGKTEKAQKALQRLRGKDADIGEELRTVTAEIQRIKDKQRPLCSTLCSGVRCKALFMAIALMFSQQFGGINAFMFYSTKIFQDAKSSIEDKWVTVLVGAVQMIATIISLFVVDKLGRRILLIVSAASQAVSCLVFGVYFVLSDDGTDVSSLSWLPIAFVIIYMIGFSIGLGPIPWLMIGELFEEDIKPFAAGIAATSNWLCAFMVTAGFGPIKDSTGNGTAFFIFAVVNILCILFTIFILPETKQKTIAEIQDMLAGQKKE